MIDNTGRTLARYKLLEEVGQGGMAVVWRAEDTTLNREVAVKILHPHLAGQAESRARLQREAHAVAKLRHENILEIFDYSGPDSPESYIVTEFIHGRTLKNFLVENPLPFPELAEMIASEVCRALEHAHQLGVIHRDIKPENVMIRDDGMLKLMDFGIAQIVDKERMTVTGQLLGSPAYMAPEHVEGRPLDFRTDVFAVGILTYQLATGQLPFRGKNPHEVLKRIAECKYAPPEAVNPLIGARLARAIKKALSRDPDDRFSDVAPLRQELLDDLADAGVEDARAELTRFWKEPKYWARDFRPRLLERLAARGKELQQKGRTAAALELWSRALAIDPGSAELQALVDGVARSRRVSSLLRVAIVLALLGGGAALGLNAWRKHRPPPPPETKLHLLPDKHTDFELKVGLEKPKPVERPVEKPRPVRLQPAIKKETAPPPPATTEKRFVELVPTPKAVRVSLDGKPLGDFGPELARMELGPGPHTFVFESPFCFPRTVSVGDKESPGRVVARLKWKPATLIVETHPPEADVLVDGRLVVRSGQPVPLPIDENSLDGRREVSVKVSAAGHQSSEVQLKLRANESLRHTVELKARGNE